MKIRAVLIEDEMPARRTVKSYLRRYFPQIDVVGEAGDLDTAKRLLEQQNFELIFLDINLKDGSGLDLLSYNLHKNAPVIFTTAFDNYALEAFKVKAFGYLLKPIDPDDFKEIVNRALKDIIHTNLDIFKLRVATSRGFTYLNASTIVRCEAESNYTRIHANDGKNYLVSKSLKYLEKQLEPTRTFIRVHQSHLVNTDFIDRNKINSQSIIMKDSDQIPISRTRKEEVYAFLKLS